MSDWVACGDTLQRGRYAGAREVGMSGGVGCLGVPSTGNSWPLRLV